MNKQDNVPQVKTVDRPHAEDVLFKFVKTVHNLGDVVNAMEEYAAQETASLKSRISELEADLDHCCGVANGLREERDKYREALQNIANQSNAGNMVLFKGNYMYLPEYAEQALNSKEDTNKQTKQHNMRKIIIASIVLVLFNYLLGFIRCETLNVFKWGDGSRLFLWTSSIIGIIAIIGFINENYRNISHWFIGVFCFSVGAYIIAQILFPALTR